MSGQIFISYRREDSWGVAGRLFDRLSAPFGREQIFMDIDSIELGENFVKLIETTVAKCDVLVAVIGNNWLATKDEHGDRRLDNPADWVRREIGTALDRQIRVIPILVDSAKMPRPTELPEDLKQLASLNALRITNESFEGDCRRLEDAIRLVLEKSPADQREKERPEAESSESKGIIRPPSQNREPAQVETPAVVQRKGWTTRKPSARITLFAAVLILVVGLIWFAGRRGREEAPVIREPTVFTPTPMPTGTATRTPMPTPELTPAPSVNASSDPEFYNDRGLSYYNRKDYDKAISDYDKAIRLDPNRAVSYNNRGNAYEAMKDYDKAISDYNEAIRLDPHYAVAYFRRGNAYQETKDYDKAISDYDETVRLEPNHAVAHNNRGFAYYEKKDYTKAIRDYNEAIRLDPKYADACHNRGLAYRQLGNETQAQADFEKAKQLGFASSAIDATPNLEEVISNNLKNAEKDHPWINSLGMKFVPVAGTQVLFSICDTRVQDFEMFVKSTGYDCNAGVRSLGKDGPEQRGATWKEPGFGQGPNYPVVGVNWNDAEEFCRWLTKRERNARTLPRDREYRLPTDAEWSAAVGLRYEVGDTPEEKSAKIELYPWDIPQKRNKSWPPPARVGNYAGEEVRKGDWPSNLAPIEGYNDGYQRTSPVGAFPANQFGLYDMGGNVWQWCEDWYNFKELYRVWRGASWESFRRDALLASYRRGAAPDARYTFAGFRCVVAAESSR
jgi:tetratricopeptide (TPR) repeat protein/formylglycine-generating enzyme required for sulfatase activity